MARFLAWFCGLALLAACTVNDLDQPPAPLGAFQLGHNIVVASKMQKVPISRPATEEEWITAMTAAIDERFGRYDGDQLYHFGISIEGFALAPPGVPLVANPKSVLAINVTVWDDAAASKLNDEVRQFIVFENDPGNFIVGSGLTNTREEQMQNLARSAAKTIERWLVSQNREVGWFAPRSAAGPAPVTAEDPDTPAPRPADG
ncbi:MAG: hypothetical protein NXH82_09085 [Rhodobacteraceae bacterium]|nr:hypothetical protein [Paracoccaceae bacterium]